MLTSRDNVVLRHLRRGALAGDGNGLTDGRLLEGFLAARDDAAFASIVRRHGPMVFGVCRRVLRHRQDAEDAFQATFVVLALKAASIGQREHLGNWLYGVAYRTALEARRLTAKRRAREKQVQDLPHPTVEPEEAWHDLRPVLDEELSRLPDRYRLPVVLCDLEGRTRKETARQLGLAEGTLSNRLAKARRLLARRLTRRGLALSAGALAAGLSATGTPPLLAADTVRRALLVAATGAAAGAVPAKVGVLTGGVLKAMLLQKLHKPIVGIGVIALLGFGAVVWLQGAEPAPPVNNPGAKALVQNDAAERPADKPRAAEPVPVRVARREFGKVTRVEIDAPKEPRNPRALLGHLEQAARLQGNGRLQLEGWITAQETVVSAAQARRSGNSLAAKEVLMSLPEGSKLRAELAGREVVLQPGGPKQQVRLRGGSLCVIDDGAVVRAVARPGRGTADADLVVEVSMESGEVAFRVTAGPGRADTLVEVEMDTETGVPVGEKQPPHGAVRWKLLPAGETDKQPARLKMQWIYNLDELRRRAGD